jgi:hypothetical protein
LEAVASTRTTIDWQRSLPWWFFLSGFVRLGWRFSHILVASFAVWLSSIGLRLFFYFVETDPVVVFPVDSIFSQLAQPLTRLTLIEWSLKNIALLAVLYVWLVLIWALFGGVICRRSIVELGAKTTLGWTSTFRLVIKRWQAIFEATGLPALAAFAFCLIPMLLGMIARLGWFGEVIASIGVVITFILSLLIAWALFVAVIGFPLMTATIVAEKDSDAFDGLSRANAYLFQRPVTLLICLAVGGSITYFTAWVVQTTYSVGLSMYAGGYLIGSGQSDLDQIAAGTFASGVWSFARTALDLLVMGLIASMFWAATAATYLLVRREVDRTDFDDLDLQEIGSPLALPPTDYSTTRVLDIGNKENAANEAAKSETAKTGQAAPSPVAADQATVDQANTEQA